MDPINSVLPRTIPVVDPVRRVEPVRPKEAPDDVNAKAASREQAERPRDETVVRFGGQLRSAAAANNNTEESPRVERRQRVDVKA